MIMGRPRLPSFLHDGPAKRRRELPGGLAPKRRILHHDPFVPAGDKCNVYVSVCSIKTQTPSQKELLPPLPINSVLLAPPQSSA